MLSLLLALSLLRQGEPGVGKTLLVEECGREWQREGVQVGCYIFLTLPRLFCNTPVSGTSEDAMTWRAIRTSMKNTQNPL